MIHENENIYWCLLSKCKILLLPLVNILYSTLDMCNNDLKSRYMERAYLKVNGIMHQSLNNTQEPGQHVPYLASYYFTDVRKMIW